jgi:hypothetical protein
MMKEMIEAIDSSLSTNTFSSSIGTPETDWQSPFGSGHYGGCYIHIVSVRWQVTFITVRLDRFAKPTGSFGWRRVDERHFRDFNR